MRRSRKPQKSSSVGNGTNEIMMSDLNPIVWYCAGCGEENQTIFDISAGFRQEFVEDCAVCCRPNVLRIAIDPDGASVSVTNELE